MDEFQDRLRELTPRQRDAWQRAGFPGIRDRDPEKLRPFTGEGSALCSRCDPELCQ